MTQASPALNAPVSLPVIDAARLQRLLLAFLLVVYVMLSLRPAAIRPLWNDEIFSLHLARFESFGELWQNLRKATDLNPPLYYVLVHASIQIFGESETAVRLPSILGYGLLVLCVYRFVSRRHGRLPAWLAALFLLGCNVSTFAYEARPYAVALGFAGLTLLCWQSASEKTTGRTGALIGLAVCLGLTISTHYYAVLLFVPFGLAEYFRTRQNQSADWPLWLALTAGAVPLLFYLPLMREAKAYSVGFWARPTWGELERSYVSYVSELSVPLVGTLLVLALARLASGGRQPPVCDDDAKQQQQGADAPRSPEGALLTGLALLPIVAILLGQLVTGVYTPRYAVFTIIGLGVLFAIAIGRILRGSERTGVVIIALFAAWFLYQGESRAREWNERFGNFAGTCAYLREHTNDAMPFVIADCHHYLQMTHYDHVLAQRSIYITSLDLPLRYNLQNTSERGMRALAELTPLHLVEFDTFVSKPSKFLLFGKNPWLLNELQRHGARLVLLEDFGDDKLFEVEIGPDAGPQRSRGNVS